MLNIIMQSRGFLTKNLHLLTCPLSANHSRFPSRPCRYLASVTKKSKDTYSGGYQPERNLPQNTEKKSFSRTYTIWAIASLLVALGAGKQWRDSRPKKIFDPPRFTPFEVVAREEASPTSIILTIRSHNISPNNEGVSADPYKEEWEKGTWSVEVKQPELQIARRYTPLPPVAGAPKSDLRFLIRKEHKGEMSGYLHTLSVGSVIWLRGPHTEYSLPVGAKNVVFFAAGTGIAPALQVAHTILKRETSNKDGNKMHIVWSNRKRADCMGGANLVARTPPPNRKGTIVAELEELQREYPNQFSVDYMVDEERTFLDQKKISQLVTSNSSKVSNASNLVLISGPEGFVDRFAGPKKWEGGKEGQGTLGGVLGRMGLGEWVVWKL